MFKEINVEIQSPVDVKGKVDVRLTDGDAITSILKQEKPDVLKRSARLTQIEADERNERYDARIHAPRKVDPPKLNINIGEHPNLSVEDLERLKKKHAKTAKHEKLRNIQKYQSFSGRVE